MKKLIYKVEGYTLVYNPETEEDEQRLALAEAVVENPTEDEIARAAEIAYNGEYFLEDDGVEETVEPTLDDRVQTLEKTSADMSEALNMILSGVTE